MKFKPKRSNTAKEIFWKLENVFKDTNLIGKMDLNVPGHYIMALITESHKNYQLEAERLFDKDTRETIILHNPIKKGLLLKFAMYKTNSGFTDEYKEKRESCVPRFYVSISESIRYTRSFFQQYPDFELIVPAGDNFKLGHHFCLVINKSDSGYNVKFFDPSHWKIVNTVGIKFVKELSTKVREIDVHCWRKGNAENWCMFYTWSFIHKTFMFNHNINNALTPVINTYDVKANKLLRSHRFHSEYEKHRW